MMKYRRYASIIVVGILVISVTGAVTPGAATEIS